MLHEAEGSEPGGPEGEKALLSSIRKSFPDWRWDIEEMLAAEDKVVTRYVVRGTHQGAYMGAAPTNKEVAITGINIVRLEGGKIVESWGNSYQLGWLRQIGVVPAEVRFYVREPSADDLPQLLVGRGQLGSSLASSRAPSRSSGVRPRAVMPSRPVMSPAARSAFRMASSVASAAAWKSGDV
jgi:predicted ester cyclase